MRIEGRALVLGDNISTDHILPSRLKYQVTTLEEMARFVLVGVSEDMPQRVKPGTILVAGENFGYGSSREHAAWALKLSGVRAVLALSFARIFYRNAINIGLPVLTIPPEARQAVGDGDTIVVDAAEGVVELPGKGLRFHTDPLDPLLRRIVEAGGIVEYVKRQGSLPWRTA